MRRRGCVKIMDDMGLDYCNILYIYLEDNSLVKRNDILNFGIMSARVVKVYRYNLWRKFLEYIGIQFKRRNCIKVKQFKTE